MHLKGSCYIIFYDPLAQLVRAAVSKTGGCGFESRRGHQESTMKLLVFLSSFLFALNVQADFTTGLIVGSLLSSPEAQKSEFEMQVRNIERNLPYNPEGYTSTPEVRALVPAGEESKYLTYFKNKGYNVALKNSELVFNFKLNYQLALQAEAERKEQWEKNKPFWKKVGWSIFALWILVCLGNFAFFMLKHFDKSSSLSYAFAKMLIDFVGKNKPK